MAKTNKSRRKRRKAAPHPMSAGPGRQPNGRTRRATTREGRTERCGPTPELVARVETEGPTDMIQRAAQHVVDWRRIADGKSEPIYLITAQEAQALEAFASIRRALGVAEYQPMGVLGKMEPQGAGREMDEDAFRRARLAYLDACSVLDPIPGAHDACTSMCDNRPPRDMRALRAGAAALAGLFIAGKKAA